MTNKFAFYEALWHLNKTFNQIDAYGPDRPIVKLEFENRHYLSEFEMHVRQNWDTMNFGLPLNMNWCDFIVMGTRIKLELKR